MTQHERKMQVQALQRLAKHNQNKIVNEVEKFIADCKDKSPIEILRLLEIHDKEWRRYADKINKKSQITVVPDAFERSIKTMHKRIKRFKTIVSEAEYYHYNRVADICRDKTYWYHIQKWLKEHFFVKTK